MCTISLHNYQGNSLTTILTFVVIVNLVIKSFCIIVAGNFGASYGKEP